MSASVGDENYSGVAALRAPGVIPAVLYVYVAFSADCVAASPSLGWAAGVRVGQRKFVGIIVVADGTVGVGGGVGGSSGRLVPVAG